MQRYWTVVHEGNTSLYVFIKINEYKAFHTSTTRDFFTAISSFDIGHTGYVQERSTNNFLNQFDTMGSGLIFLFFDK